MSYAYRFNAPAVEQRFYISPNYSDQVYNYGYNNVYPQMMQQYMFASAVCKSAVGKLVDFSVGDGFEDKVLADMVFNRQGFDGNQLLRKVASQKSIFNTVALHINYNALYEISEVRIIPVPYCRIADKDTKYAGKIAVWNNWAGEASYKRNSNNKENIHYLHTYDPRPEVVEQQIEEAGGFAEYRGQVLYMHFDDYQIYAHATFDSVLDDVITDAAFAMYRKKNVKSSFSASGILKYNSKVESEEERVQIMNEIQQYQGDEDAGNVIVVFPTEGEIEGQSPIEFTPIQPNNTDTLYVNQEKSVNSRIIGAYNQPRALHTFFDDSGIYNQDLLMTAWTYYNEQTRKDRRIIEEVFEMLVPFMGKDEPSSYAITPQRFGNQQTITT